VRLVSVVLLRVVVLLVVFVVVSTALNSQLSKRAESVDPAKGKESRWGAAAFSKFQKTE
jgi:K+-transporting ATPase A subunit